eukprot:gene29594-35724_t
MMLTYISVLVVGVTAFGASLLPQSIILNSILGYGRYCGPGPDEALWSSLKPLDGMDTACFEHDDAYRICLNTLSEEIGYDAPTFLHQIMPMRGYLPTQLTKAVLSRIPKYAACMHHADKALVKAFDRTLGPSAVSQSNPNTSLSPPPLVATEGISEPCAVGVTDYCIVPSASMLQIAAEIFRTSVHSDTL